MRGLVVAAVLVLASCGGDDDVASTTALAVTVTTSIPPTAAGSPETSATTSVTSATSASTSATATATTAVAPDAVVPQGFEQVAATATRSDGTECQLCLWLAETGDQRSLGLMYATDLGGPDGMVFRYDSPTTAAFWMKNTVMPLSIAFYGSDGAFLGAFDMAPCTADPCPTYATPANFTDAIEVPQGMLDELGLVAGSVLQVSDLPCQ